MTTYMIVYGENYFTGKPGSRVKPHKGREGKNMGRRKSSKRGPKKRPEWQIDIDYLLFQYVDDPQTIRLQETRIREMKLTGTSTVASYYPREISTPQGRMTKEERYVLDLEQCEEQIAICKDRQALVDKLLQEHFNQEEREFIRLFWLDVPVLDRGLTWIRTQAVIQEIGWLRDPDDRRRPAPNFWAWRLRIYTKWWRLLYPDRVKEETPGDYAEQVALGED